jgi:PAB-dependent poly(A)-specific ribonuclease subunit 3
LTLGQYAAGHYSIELKNFVVYLLRQPTTAEDLAATPLVAAKSLQEVENLHAFTDSLEGELMKELENGRLFRLMVKLGFINERPEFEMDPSWSETGDRYLLKLFRDYVFHQVYDDGTPVIDWGHVVECLNKFDVGVPERIMLMSRDEQSIIVVSYADLKRCSEVAFNELLKSAATKPT